MGFLHWPRLHDHVVELPVAAVMGEAPLRCPRRAEHFHRLIEACLRLLHRNAEAVELLEAVSLADAEIEAAAGEQVERRRLLRQQHRVVPRHHHHGRSEPDARGARREICQQPQRGGDLASSGEVVLDEIDAVVAELLRLQHVVDVLVVALAVAGRPARAARRAAEDAEPHASAPVSRAVAPARPASR